MTQPTDADAVRARIEKYEQWAAMLRDTRDGYAARMPRYKSLCTGFVALGFGMFAFGVNLGIYGVLCTTVIAFGGYGMLHSRLTELGVEIDDTTAAIERLRASVATTAVERRTSV